MKTDTKKRLIIGGAVFTGLYALMRAVANKRMEDSSIDDDNPHLFSVADRKEAGVGGTAFCAAVAQDVKSSSRKIDSSNQGNIYSIIIKPLFDRLFSFVALIILLPVYLIISILIFIDDPGPVFFTQKRIGKDKHYIFIHKFRSMKMGTPHDVPTHQLQDPDQYITRIGRVLRKTSLDELTQVWDIFRGVMSIIGPRPALWNQDDLVMERDKYGANDIKPGLTGLAQIRGRDELEIADKAGIDGEYARSLLRSAWSGIKIDTVCFFGTAVSVLKSDGVVEGGTGSMKRTS